MAKVSEKAREIYLSKIKDYKKIIQEMQLTEKELLLQMNKDESKANYIRLKVCDLTLNIVSYYVLMNSLSVSLLGVKSETFLNDGRKACYKAIIKLEEIFSDYLDASYSSYEERVHSIKAFSEPDRFKMIRKIGFALQAIMDGFGENTKWKWSFVELQARLATQAKNCVDLKKMIAGLDPHVEGYPLRIQHMRLTRSMMNQAAVDYRRKYELSTRRMDDFKKALDYLGGLRRLSVLLNEPNEAEALKKKIDVWRHKMNVDMQKAEKTARH
ncbi:MAG: hypothetical protein PF447_07855 [Spirochaetaceae bacterium]|jgi:hypothetical protein|nr:hypothetical protein [Spirochaetaceae bacterium]